MDMLPPYLQRVNKCMELQVKMVIILCSKSWYGIHINYILLLHINVLFI